MGASHDDKDRPAHTGLGRVSRSSAGSAGGAFGDDAASPSPAQLPVIPPVYTLELAEAKIVQGRVNGTISGTNFVADAAILDIATNMHTLTIRQGTNYYSDREIVVFFRPRPGETLEGKTYAFNKDQKNGAPQIMKRWKTAPKIAAQQKSYNNGCVLRVEFGSAKFNGAVPGKIYAALPDPEQTVVSGIFEATVRDPVLEEQRRKMRLLLGRDFDQ